MPNIASVFREEILRLARKELRSQSTSTKKAAVQHRRDIAALKRRVTELQRQVNALSKRASRNGALPTKTQAADMTKFRFVAKGFRSLRSRLGLSAEDFGKLISASGQSVYAWETGRTVPRREQVAKIAAVRALGKREAQTRLKTIDALPSKKANVKGRPLRKRNSVG